MLNVVGIESNGDVKGCLSLPSGLNGRTDFVEGNLRERKARMWGANVPAAGRSPHQAEGAQLGADAHPQPRLSRELQLVVLRGTVAVAAHHHLVHDLELHRPAQHVSPARRSERERVEFARPA